LVPGYYLKQKISDSQRHAAFMSRDTNKRKEKGEFSFSLLLSLDVIAV